MKKVRLRKDIVHNDKLSAEAVALYISLCYYTNEQKYCVIDNFSCRILSGAAGKECNIIDSISELEENNYIKIISTYKGRYIIDKSNCMINKCDYYISVNPDDIAAIVNSGYKNRFTVLRLYVVLIGTFANGDVDAIYKGKVGFMPQSYLAKLCNIDVKTVHRISEQLVSLNLIYIEHSRYYKERNYYSLPDNAELLIHYRDEAEEKLGRKNKTALDINNNNDDFLFLDDAESDF